jgi:hypothetical protein
MTADAAVAFSSVRREKLIWFSPSCFLDRHHTGPVWSGHQRSSHALLGHIDPVYCPLSAKIPSVPPSAFMRIDFVPDCRHEAGGKDRLIKRKGRPS